MGPTDQSIDSTVLAIRRRVDSWGLAGDRLYWKPGYATETEDGSGRRKDVQTLLVNGGIETRQSRTRCGQAVAPAATPDEASPPLQHSLKQQPMRVGL